MKISSLHLAKKWFTLIELLIGMTIFSVGITAIFLLLNQSMQSALHSRNEVIISGLLREQIELVRNIRDSNLGNYTIWDKAKITPSGTHFASGVYLIENNFEKNTVSFNTNWDIESSPVSLQTSEITQINELENQSILAEKFAKSQLFFDDQKRYTHEDTWTGTAFASYLILSPLQFTDKMNQTVFLTATGAHGIQKVPQWYSVDARVIVREWRKYREYDAKTTLTDWIR